MLRPQGTLVLEHFSDEGAKAGYHGLHQWNMSVRDGAWRIWSPGVEVDVTALFHDLFGVSVQAKEQERWITITIVKN